MHFLDHLSEPAKKLVDYAAFSLAGVAAVSLANAALMMTAAAGAASFVLACLRIYDWFKGRRTGHD
jgi:hypothetical protein